MTRQAAGGREVVVEGGPAAAARYFDRELSWLAFNARVLALASEPAIPLLERVRFLSIFGANLDEFCQVRIAGLHDQVAAGVTAASADGRQPAERLQSTLEVMRLWNERAQRVWSEIVRPELLRNAIDICEWSELSAGEQGFFSTTFDTRIFPTLTPLAVDPGHPFPYISGLSLNLAVIARDPRTDRRLFARVKVPPLLPRFMAVPDSRRFVPIEQVIAAHLPRLFPGMQIVEHHAFRVTRNADLTVNEGEADDLLAAVETELRRRRFGRAIRLEVAPTMSAEVRDLLLRELDLEAEDVFECGALVDLTGLNNLADLAEPGLRFSAFTPANEPAFRPDEGDLFASLRQHDILVHHPYVSFSTSVVEFIRRAALDPQVLAIKITIYRTSGDSPIIDALIYAAEHGKQVAVLLELKARFDEKANIEWARRLEQAGVHVAYGLVGYKIHSKVCLVIRDEPEGIRSYVHIGTGNYNPKTAMRYEDIGLFTADPVIGADIAQLFNVLTGYGRDVQYRAVMVAPESLRDSLRELILREATHPHGRVVMKMNSLVDEQLIDALYDASAAGVQIDLVVRGICCLRPGVAGLSENIRVRSIVGRYLEHSRIFYFANGRGENRPLYLIGSADLMPRNLDRRVEVLVPIEDGNLRNRLQGVLDLCLLDTELAWSLGATGDWVKQSGASGINLQRELQLATRDRLPLE